MRFFIVLLLLSFSLSSPADLKADVTKAVNASDKASDKVKAFVVKSLLPLMTNKVFIDETNKQNSLKISLDEIKKIDKEWQAAEDFLPIQEKLTGNACADEINKVIKSIPGIKEAFVMDNQGAVVGENDLTSDYWQGDEDKWQNSYNGGKGGIDVGKIKFDKSANSQLQQVSIPLVDGEKVIGAITFGIDISKL
ncbi:MAG: hypothetical protein NE328_17845 [Lentisphaeraceae bacterium]|nr:hypothetical protein [Lentisphaeraceae bacterium]